MLETRVITVDPLTPDPKAIAQAAAVIRAGGLVAFPTETVYGLGANALDADAAARIFAAKGRPPTNPLIVHVESIDALDTVAHEVPPLARALAAAFWPGALTLIVPRAADIPANVSAGGATVAVRMPAHPIALALIRAAGGPIAAPSANTSTRPSATTAAHVLEDLAGRVDLILDGGATSIGVESTIVDCTSDPPRVLRSGGVGLAALRAIAPMIVMAPAYQQADQAALAPGMMIKHYAPRAEVWLYDADSPPDAIAAMMGAVRMLTAWGRNVGALLVDDDADAFEFEELTGVTIARLGDERDPAAVSARLFAALRELDAAGVTAIVVRRLHARGNSDTDGLIPAINDRLTRAASARVIWVE